MIGFAVLLIAVGVPLTLLMIQIRDSLPGAARRERARRDRWITREARRECAHLDAEYVRLVRRRGRR